MVKISVLSALYEGYPGRFPSQRETHTYGEKMYALWKWRWTDSAHVTHVCVGNWWRNMSSRSLIVTGMDNNLFSIRRKAITWTNADFLPIRHLGTNVRFEQNHNFISTKCTWKCRLQNEHFSRPQCFNVLYNVALCDASRYVALSVWYQTMA